MLWAENRQSQERSFEYNTFIPDYQPFQLYCPPGTRLVMAEVLDTVTVLKDRLQALEVLLKEVIDRAIRRGFIMTTRDDIILDPATATYYCAPCQSCCYSLYHTGIYPTA